MMGGSIEEQKWKQRADFDRKLYQTLKQKRKKIKTIKNTCKSWQSKEQ